MPTAREDRLKNVETGLKLKYERVREEISRNIHDTDQAKRDIFVNRLIDLFDELDEMNKYILPADYRGKKLFAKELESSSNNVFNNARNDPIQSHIEAHASSSALALYACLTEANACATPDAQSLAAEITAFKNQLHELTKVR